MTPDQLARTYLDALGRADLDTMLSLFAADGQVHSPLYGPRPAASFFPELFGAEPQSLVYAKWFVPIPGGPTAIDATNAQIVQAAEQVSSSG
jgi:hypothetical protein